MGAIFDKYKVLHGLPTVGQKIKFVKPTMSWFKNVNEDYKMLVPDQEYTVRKTELNSSSTYVWLEEFPNIFDPNDPNDGRDQPFFNMGSFKWEPPEINLKDLIGYHFHELRTLNNRYKWGIKFKDYVWAKGTPMLVVDYDENDIVTSVKFEE